MKRTCDWSGDEYDGTFYILQTTDGPQYVSAPALLKGLGGAGGRALADILDREDAREESPEQPEVSPESNASA